MTNPVVVGGPITRLCSAFAVFAFWAVGIQRFGAFAKAVGKLTVMTTEESGGHVPVVNDTAPETLVLPGESDTPVGYVPAPGPATTVGIAELPVNWAAAICPAFTLAE